MYRLTHKTVTEARRDFTKNLPEVATGEKVVIVRKRGQPQAAIISAAEALQYFRWKAEQAPTQTDVSDGDPQLPQEGHEQPAKSPPDLGDARAVPRSSASRVTLPEGWPSPEEYVRRCYAEGHIPETVLRGLDEHYRQHGLTAEDAKRIVVGLAKEQGASR